MTELVFATYLAPRIRPVYAAVAAVAGRRLGTPTRLVDGTSFAELRTDVDFAFLCGLPYVRMPELQLVAAPVLAGDRYGGRPVYYSDIVVRRSSAFRTFADLRGARWSYNGADSHSGYSTVVDHLADRGETPAYFGSFEAVGSHAESIRRIASGAVDASAIDSQVLAVTVRDEPELGEALRIVGTIGPSPIQPLVAAARVASTVVHAVRDAVLAAHEDEQARAGLAHGMVERFVAVTPAFYDPIRRAASRVDAAAAPYAH